MFVYKLALSLLLLPIFVLGQSSIDTSSNVLQAELSTTSAMFHAMEQGKIHLIYISGEFTASEAGISEKELAADKDSYLLDLHSVVEWELNRIWTERGIDTPVLIVVEKDQHQKVILGPLDEAGNERGVVRGQQELVRSTGILDFNRGLVSVVNDHLNQKTVHGHRTLSALIYNLWMSLEPSQCSFTFVAMEAGRTFPAQLLQFAITIEGLKLGIQTNLIIRDTSTQAAARGHHLKGFITKGLQREVMASLPEAKFWRVEPSMHQHEGSIPTATPSIIERGEETPFDMSEPMNIEKYLSELVVNLKSVESELAQKKDQLTLELEKREWRKKGTQAQQRDVVRILEQLHIAQDKKLIEEIIKLFKNNEVRSKKELSNKLEDIALNSDSLERLVELLHERLFHDGTKREILHAQVTALMRHQQSIEQEIERQHLLSDSARDKMIGAELQALRQQHRLVRTPRNSSRPLPLLERQVQITPSGVLVSEVSVRPLRMMRRIEIAEMGEAIRQTRGITRGIMKRGFNIGKGKK